MNIQDTTQFTLNIGVNPGYHCVNAVKDPVAFVSKIWQEKAEEVYGVTGVYVAAIMSPAKTFYRGVWGCPAGGEDTVVVSGLRNPEFQPKDDVWRLSVWMVAERVGKTLDQTTAYLSFQSIEFIYLKPKDS